jgi:hypothetical protein
LPDFDKRNQARFEESGEIAAGAQLGNAQLDAAGPRLPGPVAIAVALGPAVNALFAIRRAGKRPDLQLHQPLGGNGHHLAQDSGIGGLLSQALQAHHLVGHRSIL